MRYHVLCPGTLIGDGWSISADPSGPRFQIDAGDRPGPSAFRLLDRETGASTEGRVRSTWRHELCDLYRAGELAATISTSLLRDIRAQFVGEVPGPDMLEIRGDFVEQNYRFYRCSRTVAIVSTVWDEAREGFGVEIRPNEDQAMVLAAVLGIRCLCGEPRQTRVFGVPWSKRSMLAARAGA